MIDYKTKKKNCNHLNIVTVETLLTVEMKNSIQCSLLPIFISLNKNINSTVFNDPPTKMH